MMTTIASTSHEYKSTTDANHRPHVADDVVPPWGTRQARELQLGLLGSIAKDFRRLPESQSILTAADFLDPEFGGLYRGYERLQAEGIRLDRTALRGVLLDSGIWASGQEREDDLDCLLNEIDDAAITAENIDYYAKKVKQLSGHRMAACKCENILARLRRGEIDHDDLAEQTRELAEMASGDLTSAGFDLELLTSKEFAELDCRPEWAIKRVLVKHQPMIGGGGKKQLKTCILTDMAISLGTKTNFLGVFEVPNKLRVGFLSGESGDATILAVATTICRKRGVTLQDAGVHWGFKLPSLVNHKHLAITERTIKEHGLEVLIYDPIYRGMGATTNTANMVEVGEVLDRIVTLCLNCGCTPVLSHHAVKHLPVGDMPELEMFSGAGYAEFARQWFLVNRREPYKSDGLHKLWVSIGGSVGFSHQFGLDVDEGVMDEDFNGRKWEVTVQRVAESIDRAKAAKAESKAAKKAKKALEIESEIKKELGKAPGPMTGKAIAEATHHNQTSTIEPYLKALLKRHEIEVVPAEIPCGKKGTRGGVGYELKASLEGRRCDTETHRDNTETVSVSHTETPHRDDGGYI